MVKVGLAPQGDKQMKTITSLLSVLRLCQINVCAVCVSNQLFNMPESADPPALFFGASVGLNEQMLYFFIVNVFMPLLSLRSVIINIKCIHCFIYQLWLRVAKCSYCNII